MKSRGVKSIQVNDGMDEKLSSVDRYHSSIMSGVQAASARSRGSGAPAPMVSSSSSSSTTSSDDDVVSFGQESGTRIRGDTRPTFVDEGTNQSSSSSSSPTHHHRHHHQHHLLQSPSPTGTTLVDMIKKAIHNSDQKEKNNAAAAAAAAARNNNHVDTNTTRNHPMRVSLNYNNNNINKGPSGGGGGGGDGGTRTHPMDDSQTVVDVEHGIHPNDILDVDTDPFSVREGCNLTWQNVNMTLPATKHSPERKLLDNVWGEVPKKQTTAILGSSGAGKTSLLNVLAGRLQSNQKLRVQADVRLNNYRVDPTDIKVRQNIAFVAQDDSLQTTSTPREAIRFSAKMRLPRTATHEQLDALTSRMLVELGLENCADTLIGGALIKGISGGERKRTSVGVELVVRPSMVFLDEPTSGLDSFSAEQCCEVLKKVANAGASVLFTIHQPASEVFATFDHLILLNKGRVMYQGSVKAIPEFFRARGFPVPYNYNPADWIIDVAQGISVQELDEAGFFPDDPREMGEPFVPEKGQDMLGRPIQRGWAGLEEPPPGTETQIGMLFRRELLHIRRDWTVSFGRVFLVGFLAFFIGLIFFDVGSADKSYRMTVTSQFGAMITVLITAMMSTSQIALFSFPDERPVFLREYSTNHYSVVSYFVAHLTTEFIVTAVQIFILVIIIYYMADFSGDILTYFLATYALAMTTTAQAVFGSCLAGSNTKLAMQLLPLLFTPQMLFSGFFVAPDLIPVWLQWAPYVCAMTYSTRIVVVEEFENCSDDPAELVNCNDLLQSTSSKPEEVWWYWIALIVLFVVFRLAALFVLQRSALKFY